MTRTEHSRIHRMTFSIVTLLITSAACLSGHNASSRLAESTNHKGCSLNKERFIWPKDHAPKLIWVSLDSLNGAGLKQAVGLLKTPHPFGLKKILDSRNQNSHLRIHEPTITAPSHISTMTCSSAGKHGTFANTQWDGQAMVSGFVRPNGTETFATALFNSGRKVVTAGYPTLDNLEPTRTVSEGFAYGHSTGKSTVLGLKAGTPLSHVWTQSDSNTTFELNLPNGELRQRNDIRCLPDPCRIENSGVENIFDVTFMHAQGNYRAYIQKLNESHVYISQLRSNHSFPPSVKTSQERCGLIFSPGKNSRLSEFGMTALIGGMEHNLIYFDRNWAHYLPSTRADALFLYLEDLDALRHQLADQIGQSPEAIAHVAKVDHLLGELVQSLPRESNIVFVGDHGMSEVQIELNVRRILPSAALDNSQILTSGGSLFLYERDSLESGHGSHPNKKQDRWLREAKKQLTGFKFAPGNESVFARVYIKNTPEMIAAGLNHKNAPLLIAFANPKFALKDSLSAELVIADATGNQGPKPLPAGQHGHTSDHELMKAFVAGWGPQLDTVDFNAIKTNLDLVPAVAQALRWPIPKHCAK